jgi:hypothetical protein
MATTIFNLAAQAAISVGSSLWIDLGIIPTGYQDWIGSWTITTINKPISVYLRTNLIGQSTGTISTTKLLGTISLSKAGASSTQDLYKKGALHTVTVIGTGTEHWWIQITAKSSTVGSVQYKVIYTTV